MLLSEGDLVHPSFYFVIGVSTSDLWKYEDTGILGKATSFRHQPNNGYGPKHTEIYVKFCVGLERTLDDVFPYLLFSCEVYFL